MSDKSSNSSDLSTLSNSDPDISIEDVKEDLIEAIDEPQTLRQSFSLNAVIQSLVTTVTLSVLSSMLNGFNFWTNHVATMVQMSWSGLMSAFSLSFEVLRFRVVEIIGILFYGGASIKDILKESLKLILSIFQGSIEAIIRLIKGPVRIPVMIDDIPLD